MGLLFTILLSSGCTITVPPKADKGDAGDGGDAILCCRTQPDAGPEGCLCEPASTNAVVVTGSTCSVNTTLNGQVLDYSGDTVATCP
jgi:hypothetical protein